MRIAVSILTLGCATGTLVNSASAQVSNQSFEVTSATQRPSVGDTVVLNFRVRLDERDLLFDTVPRPIGTLPEGIRILAIEKLQRAPDRIFHGHARLAFFRSGRQPVPVFGLPFMRAVKGVQRATLLSDSAFVDIVALLPAGNPPLKDIKGLERRAGPFPLRYLAGFALLLGLLATYVLRRRARSSMSPAAAAAAGPPEQPPTAYELALEDLRRIERENWPAQGQVVRHYAAATDVLREYLETAESVPAKERTSAEVLWSLPPDLAEDEMREKLRDILEAADLVKFARMRPDPAMSRQFLERCRELLNDWHQTPAAAVLSDATG
jgi:hypothetical protein